jgi:hypothetical protein
MTYLPRDRQLCIRAKCTKIMRAPFISQHRAAHLKIAGELKITRSGTNRRAMRERYKLLAYACKIKSDSLIERQITGRAELVLVK